MSRLPVTWHLREPPLEPVAVLGTGRVARLLASAVRPEAVSALRIAASADSLLIVGEIDHLPWVDGARYLGREDGLLVPTTRRSSVPADLLRAALAEAMPGQEFAVLEGRVFASPAPTAGADPRWLQEYSRGVAS